MMLPFEFMQIKQSIDENSSSSIGLIAADNQYFWIETRAGCPKTKLKSSQVVPNQQIKTPR